MRSNYISQINRNARLAGEECGRAETIYRNEKQHTKEEAKCYLTASELYGENARLSVGEEKEHYARLQKECVQKASQIAKILLPAGEEDRLKKHASASGAGASKEKTGKGTAGARTEVDVEPWFREIPKHGFDDVAGMSSLKKRLMNCVTDAKYAGLKSFLKMRNLHSFFFYGPPGCGKTYIVEAFAHEIMTLGYKYICLEARDILSKYVGEAENIVARMFELAEENAPCIVFIDEIDGVCKNRSLPGLPEYASSITTAFLTGYNRINNSDKEIVFIGATNYPERVDSAMISRVELIRVPMPDKEARRGTFEHALLDNLDIVCTISCDKMAEMTEGYDCRDIKYLIEHAKMELYECAKKRYKSAEEAIEALKTGKIVLDEALFNRVYLSYKPTPKLEDARRLAAWEKTVGGEAEDEKEPDGEEPEGEKGISGFAKEPQAEKGMSGFAKTPEKPTPNIPVDLNMRRMYRNCPFPREEYTQNKAPESFGAGKPCAHNADFYQHMIFAFIFASEHYDVSSDTWQETAKHYRDWLESVAAGRRVPGLSEAEQQKMQTNAAKGVRELNKLIIEEKTGTYAGFGGTSFEESYDCFNTGYQGNAVFGFMGTCGIVSSCNAVNQQTQRRLREEDGVVQFALNGLCGVDKRFVRSDYTRPGGMSEEEFFYMACSNGGTGSPGRERFVKRYDLSCRVVMDAAFWGAENEEKGIRMLTLEWLEKMYREGYSIVLCLKAEDLKQADISSRDQKKAAENGLDPYECFYPNHATTVAGFSYDRAGKVKGVWINDSGGWAKSTRVYICKEKYEKMRMNTLPLHVDLMKKERT